MRIWSKKLVESGALPTKQLKAMRYELGDMIKQYPNIKQPLVKFANNYDCSYLGHYFLLVCRELLKRGINLNVNYDNKIIKMVLNNSKFDDSLYNNLQFKEDDKEYLTICYWNLKEKYYRGMINDDEWQKILNTVLLEDE